MRSAAARLSDAAQIFAALGDTTRLQIVGRLSREGPQSIVRLTRDTEVSRQAITKHLCALEEAGLVRSDRDGRERIWALQPGRLAETRRCLELISDRWDVAIDRLRTLVESDAR